MTELTELTEPVVFAGPCLFGMAERRRQLLAGCDLRPPAQRGDVLAAVARRPAAIVLLDGYYYTVGAVTHKELLYALEAGVSVVGAASMGALRAVEMAPYGMRGVGRIFAWYRDGVLDGDDEVAVLHAPEEMGYRPLTLALVEIRAALGRCVDRGEIAAAAAERLIAAVKRLCFSERSPGAVLGLAADLLGTVGCDLLRRRLAAESVKRQDAEEALALAHRLSSEAPVERTSPLRRSVDYTSFDLERSFAARVDPTPERQPALAEVWATAQLLHPAAAAFVDDLRVRYLQAAAALEEGVDVRPEREDEIVLGLEAQLAALGGAAPLPGREVREEARALALSEAAELRFGGREEGLRALAGRLGLVEGDVRARLVDALAGGAGYLPVWWLARAFVFHPAFPAALATATAALAIQRRFEVWADGAVVARRQLRSLAANLWDCSSEEVPREAVRRGLLDLGVRSLGLDEALALLAPAELLRRPVNEYPRCRDELRRAGEATPAKPRRSHVRSPV